MPLPELSHPWQSGPITGPGAFSALSHRLAFKLMSVKTQLLRLLGSNGISEDQNPTRIMDVY